MREYDDLAEFTSQLLKEDRQKAGHSDFTVPRQGRQMVVKPESQASRIPDEGWLEAGASAKRDLPKKLPPLGGKSVPG
jgi:hypothetical protein